jgi:hypothetical protein
MRSLLIGFILVACSGLVIATESTNRSKNALERMLDERDRLIASLMKRVEALEQKDTLSSSKFTSENTPNLSVDSVSPVKVAEASSDGNKRPPPPKKKPAQNGASIEQDEEEESQRALERTLVISGALLVPYGQAEVQPGFNYLRYATQGSELVSQGKSVGLAAQSSQTDNFLGSAFLRMGLPFDSQLEAYVPYESINRVDTTVLGSNVYSNQSRSTKGVGDIRLGFAKTLLTEQSWWPDIIARLTWSSDTGRTSYLIPIGSGYNELSGSITFTKRQDPLVFFGTASYQAAFTQNNRSPGNILGFTIGTILAASPDTSLRFFLNQNFLENADFYGKTIPGSSTNISTLNVGASTVLGKGFFLDFTSGVGLTNYSPDYTVGFSFAYRLDVPYLPAL